MDQEFQHHSPPFPSHLMVENVVDGALPSEEYFPQMVHRDQAVAVPDPGELAPGWHCKCGTHNSESVRCSSCQGWKEGEINSTNSAQPAWECQCGTIVHAEKSRCGPCQRRGGKRNKSAGTQHLANVSAHTQDWACDACGHLNGYNKVRCVACPRWKEGKRPNLKSIAPPAQAAESHNQTTVATVAHENWICRSCSIVNLGKKARCRLCQSWRGGRRENVPKRTAEVNNDEASMRWTCDGCAHVNSGAKSRCGSCQHWKHGRRLNMRAKARSASPPPYVPPAGSIPPRMLHNNPWHCARCGNDNEGAKLRCGSCWSWKNGKQQMSGFAVAPAMEPVVEAVAPWVCCGCNHTNTTNIQQCESCQYWRGYETTQQHGQINDQRNDSRDHNQIRVNTQISPHDHYTHPLDPSDAGRPVVESPASPAPSFPAPIVEEAQATLQHGQQQPPWACPRCSKENLGCKARCGGCQKWKDGVRENLKTKKRKSASELWACHRCKLQNAGNKVRCKACQCWKDGGRPDVFARKLEKEAQRANATIWWPCDRCNRLNKPRNQRCGGCQRWRDGCRPGMKKKPEDARPVQATPHLQTHLYMPLQMPNQFPVGQYAPPPNYYTHPHVDTNEYPHVQDGSWTCDKCAFANLATVNMCTICEEPRTGSD